MKRRLDGFIADWTFNCWRHRPNVGVVLDTCAAHEDSPQEAVQALAESFEEERKGNKWAVRLTSAFGAIFFPNPVIFGVCGWKFLESFEKIPFTERTNPMRSEGLKPEKDYERARAIVAKHYGKRFAGGVAPKI